MSPVAGVQPEAEAGAPQSTSSDDLDRFVQMSRRLRHVAPERRENVDELWLSAARNLFSQNYLQELQSRRDPNWQQMVQPAADATANSAAQSKLGITAVAPSLVVELRPNAGEEEKLAAIKAAYKQLFGNTYILESDRVVIAESLLRNGSVTVREFVRLLAKSDLYKQRFFHSTSNNRFTELNFKHLLGRAPYNQGEIAFHLDLYCSRGYEAEIDSYIDSDEYRETFGESIVPYFRGFKYQVGQSAAAFERMRALYGGNADSDTDRSQNGQRTELTTGLANPAQPVWARSEYAISHKTDAGTATSNGAGLEDAWVDVARSLLSTGNYGQKQRTAESAYALPSYEKLSTPAVEATPDANAQSKLGITAIAPAPVIELRPNAGEEEKLAVIKAAYKQLFGNTYILESDRVVIAESLLRNGSATVREFVRLLAKSDLYKQRFFLKSSNNRFIELNFKHLLGRAPYSQPEIAEHFGRYCAKGYEAEIDSYIDSKEYRENFGENIVPYFRGFKYQTSQAAAAFPRLQALYGGNAGSDTDRTLENQKAQLTFSLGSQLPEVLMYGGGTATTDGDMDKFVRLARELMSTAFIPQTTTARAGYFTRPAMEATIDAAAQSNLGITTVAPSLVVELRPNAGEEEKLAAIKAAYKQLFGNTYILESDRVVIAESLLRNGSVTVREFVRLLAKSDLYKQRFFHSTSNNRFTELNFKHLLGRGLYSQSEIAFHLDLYCSRGYEAEIDSYIDSDEYRETFGESIVPYFRGFKYQTNQAAAGFPRLLKLYGGNAGSDTDRNQSGQIRQVDPGDLLRSGRGIL